MSKQSYKHLDVRTEDKIIQCLTSAPEHVGLAELVLVLDGEGEAVDGLLVQPPVHLVDALGHSVIRKQLEYRCHHWNFSQHSHCLHLVEHSLGGHLVGLYEHGAALLLLADVDVPLQVLLAVVGGGLPVAVHEAVLGNNAMVS